MLWCMFFFGILTLIHGSNVANVRVVKTAPTDLIPDSQTQNKHETAHKRMKPNEFQTAHKINNEGYTMKDDSKSIMQQQNPQILLSSKERPELNSALSVLINEDIMKSIELTRSEYKKLDNVSDLIINEAEKKTSSATHNGEDDNNIFVLTTSEKSIRDSELDTPNGSLVDNDFNLDEAGSESNQKSRIQIKKGPNGVDYEYEYVYYYYDEDEKSDKHVANKQKENTTPSTVKEARGKSRYTNVDRSGKPEPGNEIQGRGRSNSGLPSSDIDDVRLPQNTRFPPRSRGGDVTPAPETTSEKHGRRTGVKRPSLDFIDSDTFNTDEKQVKSNRNIENELSRKTSETTTGENVERQTQISDSDEGDGTTNAELDVENTTPFMEKAAWDLYAIIANENFNIDATTGDISDLTTTDSPTTNGEDITTSMEEEIATTTLATTTTTESTTTTTTTPASTSSGRKGLGGRNKFKLKNGSTTTTTTEAPVEPEKYGSKAKGRFGGRPSFGSGRVSRPHKDQKEAVNEEVAKQEVKPSSSLRGRTRNRFNLRPNSSTSEKSNEENTIETKLPSTTPKTSRSRPSINIRGRARVTTASPPPVNEAESKSDEGKPSTTSASVSRPSRFNLGRPAGANRLLPRGRVSSLKSTIAPQVAKENTDDNAEQSADDSTNDSATNPVMEDTSLANITEDKPAQGSSPVGLNRLKSRTKVLPTQKSSKPSAPAIVRKPNPLIGRKRIGASSTTTEASNESDSVKSEISENDNPEEGNEDSNKEAASEHIVEISSEQPTRGLGLLSNKRRLLLRRPGVVA